MAKKALPDKKKSSNIILVICLLAIAVVVANKAGCEITKRVEKTEWLD